MGPVRNGPGGINLLGHVLGNLQSLQNGSGVLLVHFRLDTSHAQGCHDK